MSKSIILFSDGTGNSSAKLFKTNVWRMYEAVDLGPNASGAPVQIAYYDNGVGTQAMKFLAVLAGIFGFGLKRNVLRLYRFACRNYRAGDSIYAFGFSRGAFTIRLVVALLLAEGVVQYSTEGELRARSLDAFRRFSKANNPNFVPFIGRAARWVRDRLVATKRSLFGPRLGPAKTPTPVTVKFIGVWDTVAAYGGPIAEITRGVDNLIWPLTMTDNCLDAGVEVARHALALDDERDSFHPILWDELDWAAKAALAHPADPRQRLAFLARLQQVWFSGMHSDVGGGYPDESLSYVSLCWMMAESKAAGLRLLPEHEKRVHDMSNSLGPLHNSRAGFASYYRYQPRKIAAFLHPNSGMNMMNETLILRDPVIGERQSPPHGQLLSCKVHESVIARIVDGTDDYAPIVLPPKIDIIPFSTGAQPAGGNPIVAPAIKSHLSQRDDAWWSRQENLWDWAWARRIFYFATAGLTTALVALPLWVHLFPEPDSTDNRWVAERITGWTEYVAPDMLDPWVRAFEVSPALFWGLLLSILVFRWLGSFSEGIIRSGARRLWRIRAAGRTFSSPVPSLLRRVRNGRFYQSGIQKVKWYDLPIIFGLLLIASSIYALCAAATQVHLSFAERGHCKRGTPLQEKIRAFRFSPAEVCHPTGLKVEKGHRYEVIFRMVDEWHDGEIRGTPEGIRASKLGPVGFAGIPFRRIVDAGYLQPIYQIRPINLSEERIPRVSMKTLALLGEDGVPPGPNRLYRGAFTAEETGELFLFANDASFLGEIDFFYSGKYGNKGLAVVSIRDVFAPVDASAEE